MIQIPGLEKFSYTTPPSLERIVKLVSQEPNEAVHRDDHHHWSKLVDNWVQSRPDTFFEKHAKGLVGILPVIPPAILLKTLMTPGMATDSHAANRAVAKANNLENIDIINLIQSGYSKGILEGAHHDLNELDNKIIKLILQKAVDEQKAVAEKAGGKTVVLDTIEKLIRVERDTPLNSKSLETILQSEAFNQLNVDKKIRICEEIAIIHSNTVIESNNRGDEKFRTPSVFELLQLNIGCNKDALIYLTFVPSYQALQSRREHVIEKQSRIVDKGIMPKES